MSVQARRHVRTSSGARRAQDGGPLALGKAGSYCTGTRAALLLLGAYLLVLLCWRGGYWGSGQAAAVEAAGRHVGGEQPVVITDDGPPSLCKGNATRQEYPLEEFDSETAFSACPLGGSQIYSAVGADLGCLVNEEVRLYCCAPRANRLRKEDPALRAGEFVMPAWACYTAPRLSEAARIAWEDSNAFYWKDAESKAKQAAEVRTRQHVLTSGLTVYTKLTGGRELQKGALLDVGSNLGYLLGAAQAVGFEHVVGLENNAKLVAASLEAYPGSQVFTDIAELRGLAFKFDVVTAYHVLEHLERPLEFLTELSGLMGPGGMLLGEVPDFCPKRRVVTGEVRELEACLRPWIQGGETGGLLNTLHLQYYTYDSLRYMLQMSGFKVLHMEPSAANMGQGTLFMLRFLATRE